MKTQITGLCIMIMLTAGCRSGGDAHDHPSAKTVSPEGEAHSEEIIFTRQQAETVGLRVQTVVPGTFGRVIKTSGQIQTPQGEEITVSATANGMVSFTNPSVADGTVVKAGEAIVAISAGNLPDGDPGVKAKIAYETALKEYLRAEALSQDQIISAKEFEQIRSRYETAKTVYEAQASNFTPTGVRVTAPVSGFIRNRFVRQGEYVTVGQPIATISQNRRLQLRADVPEKYFKSIRSIRSANFKMPYDDTIYKLSDMNGRLLSFGKATDRLSFRIPVTFEFDNTGDILPGSFTE
ncbi:MAG: efflux RND transporter periplasmic adaptor subunit, partial [Tannerella sp.]|nr:efflux RND transporter periplasmic adaptor subunit [Tannerella sp.]